MMLFRLTIDRRTQNNNVLFTKAINCKDDNNIDWYDKRQEIVKVTTSDILLLLF